ncbi:MAG TPA: hypothetical protein VF943_08340 [Burkholderiales bacterium]
MDLKRDENEAAAQRIYARWLDISTRVAFAVSLAAFLAYATGALAPFVPLEALPALWGLPVDEFLRRTGAPSGWGWLELAARGDYLNLACIALLPLVTALCYLRLLPALLGRHERLLAAIAAVQVLVLAAAASGFFVRG